MRWQGRRESSNVEDRRGIPTKGIVGGGLGTIIIGIIYFLMSGDPSQLIQNIPTNVGTNQSSHYVPTPDENELADFSKVVLAETETVWTELFKNEGFEYEYPILVLFSGTVESACGVAGSSTGPFYCSGDNRVYIDLSFFTELKQRFGAPGDFACAYVIAHEVGHHVQNLLGINRKVMDLRNRLSEVEFNKYLVKLELQADYFAGVWAHYAQRMNILEKGDIEEALNAANAIGDDRLQKQAMGYVVPDNFTHGTSDQRMKWFKKGFDSGDMNGGNTFELSNL
jgi:hypothetical protein